ncbi:MAG: exodeoxyribonuclease III [Leptospiraceae bacterium]|nr:exodeoxyribonuclease III [Leptospiraceae bacterium]
MKLVSFNCNGIRSALGKGLKEFLIENSFDVISLQEVKAHRGQFEEEFLIKLGYELHVFPAEKKGYSGTAVFLKDKKAKVKLGMGNELYDREGRVIQVDFADFTLMNTYFPSGTSGEERQNFKMKFLADYEKHLMKLKKKRPVILCGDINIAHTENDIHDPKGNAKNSGFLPEEREWVSSFIKKGWIDTFRLTHENEKGEYSWWTYRFGAKSRNKGWRIDYFFVTEDLKSRIKSTKIFGELNASDHAPVFLELR